MAVVVVGGHTRNIGKTSVVAGLIAAIPERQWIALKITQYGHGICSRNGRDCHCATGDHSFSVSEEKDPRGRGDSCRMLAAGARRAFWVRTRQGRMEVARPAVRGILQDARDAILESNSVLGWLVPDLYLSVLDPAAGDFKESARRYLPEASAVIVHRPAGRKPAWGPGVEKQLEGKQVFYASPPEYVSPELVEFVRRRLRGK